MFRIFAATGRSVQQRSLTTLGYLRPFHPTVSTRQSSSAAAHPIEVPAEVRSSSVPTAHSSIEDSISILSTTKSEPLAANDPADSKINPKKQGPRGSRTRKQSQSSPLGPLHLPALSIASINKPRTPRARKLPEQDDDAVKTVSAKPKKPRPSRIRKKVQTPDDAERKASSKASTKKSSIRQSARQASFTSEDARADFLPYLQWARGGKQVGKPIGDKKRINIASRELCDDIIKRLEPSLQKHIGCDIIDVNPGAGIWSEKLHDFLKPRTHILLEPDEAFYRPLLQPLIDAPRSTYKLVPKSGIVWGHLEKVLSKEYLPHQGAFEKGDPRLEEQNDSLLFIANLGYHPMRAYRGFPSVANLVLYQFMSAIRAHSLFQRYGHVRMLIWIENEERSTILPRTISLRRKSAIEAEISCERIQEVASSTDTGVFRREDQLELERTRLVYENMKEMGVGIPENRESIFLAQLRSKKPHDVREGFLHKTFLKELDDLEARFAAGEFEEEVRTTRSSSGKQDLENAFLKELNDLARRPAASESKEDVGESTLAKGESNEEVQIIPGPPRSMGRPRKYLTPQFSRLRDLRYRLNQTVAQVESLGKFNRELNEIYSLQRKVHEATESERGALEEELKESTQTWKAAFNELLFRDKETLGVMLDNVRAVETNPPTLVWDRREIEPLRVHAAEFYPQKEMCLLDFQPKSLWPILQKDFPENYDVFEYIIGQLLIVPTQNIKKGLTALAPGAYEYLIAECPSLTDPTKGGSLDVELMSVRRLTEEMLKEIIEAWLRWPFKPTRFEMMGRMGSAAFDPDTLVIDE